MGAFAPSPLITPALHEQVMREIVRPVIDGMAAEGYPFTGFLYVGLMLTPDGPRVIEFNVRLGDPEAQVILPRIAEPLTPLLLAAARGALEQERCVSSDDRLVGVVLASRGYPDSAESGQPISGIADARACGATVLHAGTATKDGHLVTAGGRVLTVVASGADFADARTRAYAAVHVIRFDGMQYRTDIGLKTMRETTI
jgi:phosphoribosylamine--glycine ligase